ncbi:protein phosphatase regulator [Vanrija albida]|uniref:Protein phosphatase regulator n=1 Tax=Vanrija albida TaxID=181172 RepID=A0ABR3PRJ1_9TREE
MAQIIPPITSLPVDSNAAPSVEDIQDKLPSICVDYLSHNWTEEDVWASWRNMTRHKHEIANGVRLENASWRTWNKQRNKLRTISPETLNWLKDSDVTWLYGPLHTASVEPVRPLKISSTDDRLGIDRPTGAKGILKHRTLSELLSIPGPSSPVLEATEDDDSSSEETTTPRRPGIPKAKSDVNVRRSVSLRETRRRSPSALRKSGSPTTEAPYKDSGKRHISFNTFVEQVIALDEPLVSTRGSVDSDDDDMLEMRSSSSRHSGRSRASSITSTTSVTIAKIAPAMLKTTGTFTQNPNLPKMVYQPPPEYLPSPQEQQPAAASPYDIPSPIVLVPGNRWNATDDEDEYSHGRDYFGGPDLSGTSPARAGSYGRAPAVQPPPAQPKWRLPNPSLDPSSSSSSSSSLNANGIPSPQPGRSILKVRPPTVNASTPEPVSPPAHFNYNPSVATGIGGMFGGYEGLPVGSPPNEERGRSTATTEGRGRSTSRGAGSSQYDRSASSRGTSTSSSSSVSRSPVDNTPVKTASPTVAATQPKTAPTDAMDVDYSPERSSTPTPHSSPQIVFRPLKDTSPASLPHPSNRPVAPGLEPELPVTPTSDVGAASVAYTTAQPTLSQPVDDDDGSTLIGRATNIANTAKDLLGALWYGAQDDNNRPRGGQQTTGRRHARGSSLG